MLWGFLLAFSYISFHLRTWWSLALKIGMTAYFLFATLHCIAFSASLLVALLASGACFIAYFADRFT